MSVHFSHTHLPAHPASLPKRGRTISAFASALRLPSATLLHYLRHAYMRPSPVYAHHEHKFPPKLHRGPWRVKQTPESSTKRLVQIFPSQPSCRAEIRFHLRHFSCTISKQTVRQKLDIGCLHCISRCFLMALRCARTAHVLGPYALHVVEHAAALSSHLKPPPRTLYCL